ncbi:hypothetical protein COT97_00270 [Candidatus Falkowbacteria bacterium CG10_big_fil_rev_8_21_14_0_10_39_11]|uniref:Peptidase MA-like domain-containing protein n=1 Tax=Candidatus Falkowbacteria bacterium CG10_big_fil_rev_8_21_14_0_10_39_11 TaxID=1974565 RepID=A0A2H0V6K5_9BACT|nr:MAG: hypothetical protein COT97_00270 [Candidatus Falkowbacteria bacterium CG10_big_fil_rev_8_21_14_0_10_39_11]
MVNMNLEDISKTKPHETIKTDRQKGAETLQPKEVMIKIECPERQEVMDRAVFELKKSFQTLGIEDWALPEIKVKFVEATGAPILGNVEVHSDGVEIIFDQRFSSMEDEKNLVDELHLEGMDYPGMQQTLKHELAHVAMWSVTGLQRQPATRLLDEGWASLLENTDDGLPTKESAGAVKEGLLEEADLYNRCLDFSKPVTFEEDLNAAEYKVGQALLLWIKEVFGTGEMIKLIKASPSPERRNDDLTPGDFEPAVIDNELHSTAPEYLKLIADVKLGRIPGNEAINKSKEWEGKQFQQALLEASGYQNIDEVRAEFLKWVQIASL